MDDNSLFTTEVLFSLKDLGIREEFIRCDHITMTQRYMCVRETNNVVIIDTTSKPIHPIRLSITADSAIMNPDTPILALKVQGGGRVQIFDVEAKTIMKSYNMAERVKYWKWITPKMLGLCTDTAIYHWSIEGLTGPIKMFDRTLRTGFAQSYICNYLCHPSEKWHAVINLTSRGIFYGEDRPDLWRPPVIGPDIPISNDPINNGHSLILIESHENEHQWSEIPGVLLAAFATSNVEENGRSSTLLCYAQESWDTKEEMRVLKICVTDIEFVAQSGEPCFRMKRAEYCVYHYDIPQAMQVSQKDGLIYILMGGGRISVHGLETAEPICSYNMINFEIFYNTEGSSSFYTINKIGQVFLTDINDSDVQPLIRNKNLLSRGTLHDLRKVCLQMLNKIEGLKEQYTELKNEKESIVTKLENSLQEELRKRIENEEMKRENTKLRDKIEGLEKHCAELQNDKESIITKLENSLQEEIRKKEDTEEQFMRMKIVMLNAIEKMKKEKDNTKLQEENIADTTKSLQIKESSRIEIEQLTSKIKELNKFQESHEEMLNVVKGLKKQIAELTIERDKTIRDLEEFRLWIEGFDSSTNHLEDKFIEFTHAELKAVTNNFSDSLLIGEGGYGLVYKAFLGLKPIAIKIFKHENNFANNEFNQEVKILSSVRHPNLVVLVGACTEKQALVYELMPNGSLFDNLRNKQQSNVLTWKTRICIASNICSALICLHSTKPHGIVHGDLKPANILLDSNYTGKLSDFGICRHLKQTDTRMTPHHFTINPKGTFPYMDPEYFGTGEMTAQYDVYSFGIVLLELVTGRDPVGLRKSVKDSLRKGQNFVDASAGEWPFEEAKRMVLLGLQCSDPSRENRPDLEKEVWVRIESMRRASLRS